MDRTELFAFAIARGWTPGVKLTLAQRAALRTAIRNRLTLEELRAARVHESQTPREMTADDAAEALVEELG